MADTTAPQTHLTARQKARKRAVDILFESDLRERDPMVTLAERTAEAEPPVGALTADLVRGVVDYIDEIDQTVSGSLSEGWSLARMPRVDRTIARIAVYELDHTSTPREVVIAEAVRLATALSTDESPGFLNGLLARIVWPDSPDA